MFTFTDMAVDYSVDELDDLTSRKVAAEGIDGTRLALIVRAQRGAARAAGKSDPYPALAVTGQRIDSGATVRYEYGGNRRMVAVGRTGPLGVAVESGLTTEGSRFYL
jgi:hypothetical protein